MSSPKNRRSPILVEVAENQELEAGIHYQPPTYSSYSDSEMVDEDKGISVINENYTFNSRREERKTKKKLEQRNKKMLEFIFK